MTTAPPIYESALVAALTSINTLRRAAGMRLLTRADVWQMSVRQRLDALDEAKKEAERVEAERGEKGLWG